MWRPALRKKWGHVREWVSAYLELGGTTLPVKVNVSVALHYLIPPEWINNHNNNNNKSKTWLPAARTIQPEKGKIIWLNGKIVSVLIRHRCWEGTSPTQHDLFPAIYTRNPHSPTLPSWRIICILVARFAQRTRRKFRSVISLSISLSLYVSLRVEKRTREIRCRL